MLFKRDFALFYLLHKELLCPYVEKSYSSAILVVEFLEDYLSTVDSCFVYAYEELARLCVCAYTLVVLFIFIVVKDLFRCEAVV